MTTEKQRHNLGTILSAQREKMGLSIYSVSEELKIRAKYISAIENLDIDTLPSKVYFLGYLKNYAEFLQLDSADVLEKFKDIFESEKELEVTIAEVLPENTKPTALMVYLAAMVCALIYTIWYTNFS